MRRGGRCLLRGDRPGPAPGAYWIMTAWSSLAGVINATARLIADRHDDEAIEDEATHLRVVAAFQW
jgi:hypothetical protein